MTVNDYLVVGGMREYARSILCMQPLCLNNNYANTLWSTPFYTCTNLMKMEGGAKNLYCNI